MTTSGPAESPRLFNSNLETGVRAVVLLNAAFPRSFDLARLIWLDHLVVHTRDIGGPESLHPPIPGRNGELLVRRRLLESSLNLMRRLHLINIIPDETGIKYQASDEAPAFVTLLNSKYSNALKIRAEWLVAAIGKEEPDAVAKRLNPEIDNWLVQFQSDASRPGELL